MKIIITGAEGFIGKNLVQRLNSEAKYNISEITRTTSFQDTELFLKDADFIFHLAGVNRSENKKEFLEGNKDFLAELINLLEKHNNYPPILFTSSIQAEQQSLYGESKKAAEILIKQYSEKNKVPCYIYQLPNVFGKWSKPNYNSVIATFCYNISRGLDIEINDPEKILSLVYIDDVVDEFLTTLTYKESQNQLYYKVVNIYEKKVKDIARFINNFYENREKGWLPNLSDTFIKNLYSTYLSYLPKDKLNIPLNRHEDTRGSFTEFVKSDADGQISINISKPGITKGNHWHHTKVEKFLVIKGAGVIYIRDIYSEKIYQYHVSGKKFEVIDIPAGAVHSIENTSTEEMITVMWVNEPFHPEKPDTFPLEV